MDFELRVPCLEGVTHVSCKNCHICLNSLAALTPINLKQQQQQKRYCKATSHSNNNNSKLTYENNFFGEIFASASASCTSENSTSSRALSLRRVCTFLILLNLLPTAAACGPGRGIGGPRIKRKLTPLVFKQHIPNMAEQSLGASGVSEGSISRNSAKFKKLEFNNNRDIIFKDEEGTGADHVMTRRCRDLLNVLAISVMNQWPGVRLRVIESWDEEYMHDTNSLHYEGRAVDITTSDRDRSKYGMLARLAVEAGFDWVYYATRAHIHCSVKADSFHSSHENGCFVKDSVVTLDSGERKIMSELVVGDRVLSIGENGEAIYSEIILFLDRDLELGQEFVQLTTETGAKLTVTPAHLIMIWNSAKQLSDYVFADRVEEGDQLFVLDHTGLLRPEKVVSLQIVVEVGVVAPLTREGTIVVNSVAASCYAVVNSQTLAHWSLAPVRMWSAAKEIIGMSSSSIAKSDRNTAQLQNGIHWYTKALYSVKNYVLPRSWRY